jgi:hypothetical protein
MRIYLGSIVAKNNNDGLGVSLKISSDKKTNKARGH